MHPLDVKISLSNEINVIRIECVKQKKNPFSNLSHLPSFLGLHITQRFTVPRLWHWGTPGSLHPLPDYRHLLHSQVGKGSCGLESGGSPKLIFSPAPTSASSQGIIYCSRWTRDAQLVSEDASTLSLYLTRCVGLFALALIFQGS